LFLFLNSFNCSDIANYSCNVLIREKKKKNLYEGAFQIPGAGVPILFGGFGDGFKVLQLTLRINCRQFVVKLALQAVYQPVGLSRKTKL